MSDQLGKLASFRDPELSWGFGAAVRYSNRMTENARLEQYGWVGGNYAMLWIDPNRKLVAFFAFPVTPPGDIALLEQFRQIVSTALAEPSTAPVE